MEEHYKLSKTIAEKSVTVVKLNNELIPFDSSDSKKTLIVNITNRKTITDPHFNEAYKENFSLYKSITLDNSSNNKDYKIALDIGKDCEMIIVASYFSIKSDTDGKILSESQLKFINNLLTLNKQLIIISFENPYILSLFPQAENYICTFSNSQASQRAVVNFLKGSIEPSGKLPVSIPNTDYKIGYQWRPNI